VLVKQWVSFEIREEERRGEERREDCLDQRERLEENTY
jgi:hypothetical protein